ncbi:MAG: hypothetical protein NXI27_25095 [Alphaproteobacteria bacterium]|nr:hypothetical protein [Alphaproteobacteria bacterium]
MALAKSMEKLKKYFARLEAGKVKKIKPSHVEKVIVKLAAKERSLLEEIEAARKPSKKQRLRQKLDTTRQQIDRARWLMDEIR